MGYEWNAGDISNIVTISAAALASVLMVLFKSRCSEISVFWGLWKCNRTIQEAEDEDEDEPVIPPVRPN